jgi:hypothetical protein
MRSILFLNREYIPFLPLACPSPCGPTDPPLLSAKAPSGWWDERASELFQSAEAISGILDDLRILASPLRNPFSGFCLFSAATTNLYARSFPWMIPHPCSHISHIVERDFDALNKFRNVWRIGQGWWITLQDCRSLYDRASQSSSALGRNSRLDHGALHSAIQDPRGQAPQDREYEDAASPSPDARRLAETTVGDEVDFDWGLNLELGWDQMWPIPASRNATDHGA